MKRSSDKLWLERKYHDFILHAQSPDQVIESLKNEYGICSIPFEKMDKIMQSVYLNQLKYSQDISFDDFKLFSLSETSATQRFYKAVRKSFGPGVGVYILKNIHEKSQFPRLSSNCNILDFELTILSGINEIDVRDRTPAYFYYLLFFQMFEESAEIAWEEHFAARNCKAQR